MKLTIKYDATHEVWFAHGGDTEADSNWIGQGNTAEDACADYWYQASGKAVDLSHDDDSGCWVLSYGCTQREFKTREAAIQWAESANWQII